MSENKASNVSTNDRCPKCGKYMPGAIIEYSGTLPLQYLERCTCNNPEHSWQYCPRCGKELSVPISMPDEKKEYIWNHQDEYLNKYVEYKYMTVGMKDLPRIPKMIRMREDK